MSAGWDFKWCPVSGITTPLTRSRLKRAARETDSCCRYMAEILPLRLKTQSNQSINQKNTIQSILYLKKKLAELINN